MSGAVVTLWGGPEDGLDVQVLSGQTEYTLNSPSSAGVGIGNKIPDIPVQRACYRLNKSTMRWEWKGYLREHPR